MEAIRGRHLVLERASTMNKKTQMQKIHYTQTICTASLQRKIFTTRHHRRKHLLIP